MASQLEDLTTAIETAWEMAGLEEDGRLQFHEETRLLYVRGRPEQLDLTEQALDQMRAQLASLQHERESQAEIEARLNVRLEEAERALSQAPELFVNFRDRVGDDDREAVNFKQITEELGVEFERLLELRERFGDRNPMVEERVERVERLLQSWRSGKWNLRQKERAQETAAHSEERMQRMADEIRERREQRRRLIEDSQDP